MSEDTAKNGCSSSDKNILFDENLLKSLDYSKSSCSTNYGLSYQTPGTKDGRKLIARPLERGDFSKDYLLLLSQLTRVGEYGCEVFEAQFDRMKQMSGSHYVVVVEDPGCMNGRKCGGRVIATASLIVECKFVHGAAMRGRIEDVVVDTDYRGMHLGTFLLETLSMCADALGCYKVTVDCKAELCPYYAKVGFGNEGQCFLTHRFFD